MLAAEQELDTMEAMVEAMTTQELCNMGREQRRDAADGGRCREEAADDACALGARGAAVCGRAGGGGGSACARSSACA